MSNLIKIENAKIIYPSVYTKAVFDNKETKYEVTFLIGKQNKSLIDQLKSKVSNLLNNNDSPKLDRSKICVKDGDKLEKSFFEGYYCLKASSPNKPQLFDRQGMKCADNCRIFANNAIVNGMCELWFQNNQYGKRINCTLHGLQFVEQDDEGIIDVSSSFNPIDSVPFEPVSGKNDTDKNFSENVEDAPF